MSTQISKPSNGQVFVSSLLLALSFSSVAQTAVAPPLGTTSTYAVTSSTYTNSNTPPATIITGTAGQPAVCYTTPPTTPPIVTVGTTIVPCPPSVGSDQAIALVTLNSQACISLGAGAVTLNSVVVPGNPPGVFPPGCYSSGGGMDVTVSTTVTLNGPGIYVFRPGGALTTGANSRVVMAAGGCAADVYWAPGAAVTLGTNAAPSPVATFVGNILDAAGISVGHFANVQGRLLGFGGTVLSDASTITVPTCAPFVAPITPTLAKSFNPTTINTGGVSTFG